jgi:hypothetical protein
VKIGILVLVLLPLIFVYSKPDANSPAELVGKYNEGIKSSLTELLESSIGQNSNIIVKNNVVDKINNYDKEEFINLIQKKVIGNWKNDSQVSYLYEDGNTVAVKLENINGKTKYQSYLTCLKAGEEWKIVNIIITINKVAE